MVRTIMKKDILLYCNLLLFSVLPTVSLAAPAANSLLAGMHGTWRTDDTTLPEPLFMTIDVESKTVTLSNTTVAKSDKFTVGFEEGNSIVLIARDHREAMYFEIKDNNTMITKADGRKAPRVLKRVSDSTPGAPAQKHTPVQGRKTP